tara:strand:- start:896 stop:1690 length:795 start_codon:yes stop_codon:yes gene_type:complete
MALSITTSSNGVDYPSGVIGDLKYKVIEITFDSSYPTGGESLTASDIGFDQIVLAQIEPTDGMSFAYDYTNSKVKAYGVAPVPVKIKDDDSAASNGVAVYAHIDTVGTDADRKIAHLESVTANNATVYFTGTSSNSATGTMWDDDAAASGGLQVYVDEDGDTSLSGAKFLVDNDTTETDLYVPLSDGSYLTLYNDDSASSNGVAVYFDDNASNTYDKWLLVTPSNADVSVHTSTVVSDRSESAEVQATGNLSLQTSIRAFILGH